MKVGMLIPEFPTQTHIFFWREIVALRKLGVEVALLSTRAPKEECPHAFGREAAKETHYVFPPSLRSLARSRFGPGALARVGGYVASLSPESRAKVAALAVCAADLTGYAREQGIDHVHVHSCADSSHIAAMSRLMSGPSYSVHVHGDLAVYGKDHAQKMAHAAFVGVAARPHMEQVVQGARVPRNRVFRMIMGVDVSRSEPRPRGDGQSPLRLASVSRLALCKGHTFALQAIRRLRDSGVDVRYSIAGLGPDRDAIAADVARLGLEESVKLVGPLSEDGVRALLRGSDVFLLTSVGLGEASPVAVMEAAACGVPSVCSRIGGTADMIDSWVDGVLVDQQDVEGIAEAIRRLHANRDDLERMSGAARTRAEREFDAMVLARQFVSVIESTR
jgi:glycosyltransferase involved in cell wall biosynthesis